jgi:ABC-type lipopolysaccharide export system ATPase subunit
VSINYLHQKNVQKVREVLGLCNRVYSIKLGRIVFEGLPGELKENKEKLKELFL